MLFSVLTRKGKVPRLNFHPPRSRPWLTGGGPCAGQLPCPGAFIQHPVWVIPPAPRPGWGGSWQRPQGQVPRPCPAIINEGARRPGPSRPSGFSFNLERIVCIRSTGIRVVANAHQVNPQLTATALLWEEPNHRGGPANDVQCPYNLTLASGHLLGGDNWSKLHQLLKLECRDWSGLKLLPQRQCPYTPGAEASTDCDPWRPPAAIRLQTSGWGRGSLLLRCFKVWAWLAGGCGEGSGALRDPALSLSQALQPPLTSHHTLCCENHCELTVGSGSRDNGHANGQAKCSAPITEMMIIIQIHNKTFIHITHYH